MADSDKKKVIVISGASSGIGSACFKYLTVKGHRVFGTSRRAPDFDGTGSGVRERIPENGEIIRMDVNSDDSVLDAVDFILQQTGRIDVLVNNAGIALAGAVEDTSIDEARSVFETNFWGTVRLTRAVLPAMRTQKNGYIVNMGSIGGIIGLPFQAFYCASKFALEGMSEALRLELRPFGVHVILIEPGDFRTALTEHRKISSLARAGSCYSKRFSKVMDIIERGEREGNSPVKIARLLERIINDPRPKPRYRIGKPSDLFAGMLKNRIPDRLFEALSVKYWKLSDRGV